MANKKVCTKCGEEKTIANYIGVKSEFHTGSLPICRACIASMIREHGTENWNFVNKLCQWADVPFVPEEWDKIWAANKSEAFGMYVAIFRNKAYEGLDWEQYNMAYTKLKEQDMLEESIATLNTHKREELLSKWGPNYDDEQIRYLERLHNGIINSQNVVGALNEDQALKLCKISLLIEEKIRANVDFSKDLKSYDELVKLANFTPKTVRDADEFESFGEVASYLEKTGWTNEYYDGAVRDEVDNIEKNVKNWLRYLYVNENGIGEEIEQRIQNLKIAAELEGEEFDEKEFRDYMDDEEGVSKEDFKIFIDDEEEGI